MLRELQDQTDPLDMDATTATLILGIATLAFGFMTSVFTGIMTYVMTRMNQNQIEVKKELEEVHKTTNGLHKELMEANKKEGVKTGILEERDRAIKEQAAVDRGVAEEKSRADSGTTVATVNGTVAENVQVVKEDVHVVKGNVADIKAEVIKDVKEGVAEGIEESKRKS